MNTQAIRHPRFSMRTYPVNSPEAVARIVGVTMLADGQVCGDELHAFDEAGGPELLGLSRQTMSEVLRGLCDDLLLGSGPDRDALCSLDGAALSQLLAEVDDPALQQRVLALCLRIAEADDRVSDGEALVLTRAVELWGLQSQMFGTPQS